ncbi:MAG TPA: hypothetical protein VJ987_12810 [Anaerolineales bacterium]|nr:hypothetical protein [Anaerolineales bacterium]
MSLLRQVFGPSKEEIWSQLSGEIGAEYQERGFFKEGKVVLSHRQWEITLDTYTVHTGKTTIIYTRMRAPYVNRDGFQFNIYRKNIFSGIGKMFGGQDIEVGDAFFDDQFIIKGEPEHLVRSLLTNGMIRHLIQEQKDIHFQVKDDDGWFKSRFPEGVDELYFEVVGVIKDRERLKKLFDLFSLVLDELCRLGSAYETDPNVKLE